MQRRAAVVESRFISKAPTSRKLSKQKTAAFIPPLLRVTFIDALYVTNLRPHTLKSWESFSLGVRLVLEKAMHSASELIPFVRISRVRKHQGRRAGEPENVYQGLQDTVPARRCATLLLQNDAMEVPEVFAMVSETAQSIQTNCLTHAAV